MTDKMVKSGILTYWDLCRESDRRIAQEGLLGLGFEREAPAAVSELRALEAALRDLFPRPSIIRSIKHGTGWQVIEEQPAVSENTYDTTLVATLSASGELTVKPEQYQQQVQERLTHHCGVLGNEEFARSLVQIVLKLGGLYLRPMGGAYWLPEESIETWEKVIEVVKRAKISDDESTFGLWSALFDERGRKSLRDAMIGNIHSRLRYILKRVALPQFRAKFIQARIKEIESLKAVGRSYEQVLKEPIPEIGEKINSALMAAAFIGKTRFPTEF